MSKVAVFLVGGGITVAAVAVGLLFGIVQHLLMLGQA